MGDVRSPAKWTPQELLDDAACLAEIAAGSRSAAPRPDKKSTIYAFTFPAQDFKLRVGDEVLRAEHQARPRVRDHAHRRGEPAPGR